MEHIRRRVHLSNDPIRPDTVSDTKGLFLHVVLLVCLQELSAETSSCGREVGWPLPGPGGVSSSTQAHLVLDARFPCNGTITAWVYRRSRAKDAVFLSVWRQLPADLENYYQLVGKNHIPAGRPGRRLFVVNPTHQIVVQQGDFLGFHYSVHSVAGVIDVQNVSRHANHSAPTTPQQTLQAGLYDENFLVNLPINFNTNDRKVIAQQNAFMAVYKRQGTNDTHPLPDKSGSTISNSTPKSKSSGNASNSASLMTNTMLIANGSKGSDTAETGRESPADLPWSGAATTTAVLYCGNNTHRLSCNQGLVLLVSRAQYGRTRQPCLLTRRHQGPAVRRLEPFRANCLTNVWPLVTGRCSHKPECVLHVTDDVFGQPCAETGTGLLIEYMCLPSSGTEMVHKDVDELPTSPISAGDLSSPHSKTIFSSLVTTPGPGTGGPSDRTNHVPSMSIRPTVKHNAAGNLGTGNGTSPAAATTEAQSHYHHVTNSTVFIDASLYLSTEDDEPTPASDRGTPNEPLLGGLVGGALCGCITMATIGTVLVVYLKRQRRLKIQGSHGLVQSHIIENKLQPNPLYQSSETLQAIRRLETHPRRSAPKFCGQESVASSQSSAPPVPTENVYLTMGSVSKPSPISSCGPVTPARRPPLQHKAAQVKQWLAMTSPYSNLGRQVIYPQYGTGGRQGVVLAGQPRCTVPSVATRALEEQEENPYYNIADSEDGVHTNSSLAMIGANKQDLPMKPDNAEVYELNSNVL